MKSGETFEARAYQIDGEVLSFEELDGAKGPVDINQVDWRKTTEITAHLRTVETPAVASQVN
jgi:hypothetical protein